MPAERVEYELYVKDKATGQLKKLSDALGSLGRKAAQAGRSMTYAFREGKKEAEKTKGELSNLEKTLGRLQRTITAFIGVWAFRKVTQGMAALVRSGIEFNKTMEQTKIGIGAVLAAQARIIDATGRELQGREKVLAAQRIAVKIQQDLLEANLKTAATYEELLRMFEQAFPHALAEQFDIGQIEEFVVAMSQAATAMGIPLNMMAEEMRAMLKGTITAKNTLIATALHMDKDVIRRLQGRSKELFDYIMERLRAFQLSAPDTAKTWEAAFTNMKQAFSQSVGEAMQEFFEANKETMREMAEFFRSEEFKAGIKGLATVLLLATKVVGKGAVLAGKISPSDKELRQDMIKAFDKQIREYEDKIARLKALKEIAGKSIFYRALLGPKYLHMRTPEEYQDEIDVLMIRLKLLREERQRYIRETSDWYKEFKKLQEKLHKEAVGFEVLPGKGGPTEEEKKERQKILDEYEKAHKEVVDRIKKATLDETDYKLWKLKEWYEDTKKIYEKAGKDTTELKLQYIREQLRIEEEAAQKIEKIRKDLVDKTKELTLPEGEYKRWSLDQEIADLKKKAKGNKELLDAITEYRKAKLAEINKEERERWLKSHKNTREYLEWHLKQMEENGATIKELEQEKWEWMKKYTDDALAGMKIGWNEYLQDVQTVTQRMADLVRESAQAMEKSFSDFFFDVIQGKLKRLSDYVRAFFNSLARATADVLAQQTVGWIGGWVKSKIPASKTPTGPNKIIDPRTGKILAIRTHQGGVVGSPGIPTQLVPASLFIGAPRLHEGLKPDEFPAILQKGEEVIPRNQAKQPAKVTVNIINKGLEEKKAEVSKVRMDARQLVLDIVLTDLAENGPLRQALGAGGV